MNSQEVRDLIIASDSETDMFDDDVADPSYLPGARSDCDSSSEDDQQKPKKRKIPANSPEDGFLTLPVTHQQRTISASLIEIPPGTSTSFKPANENEVTETTSDQINSLQSPTPSSPDEEVVVASAQNGSTTSHLKKKRIRSVKQRKERDASLHPVRDGCSASCKKKCNMTFGPECRRQINQQFWSYIVEKLRQEALQHQKSRE